MRSHNSLVFLFAGFTGLVRSQTFPDEASMPGCGETCLDNLISQASTFGCEQNAIGCLCAAPAFSSGVHDCATGACAPDLLPSVTNYLAGVCATAVAGAPPAPSSATPAAPSAPPTSSSVPAPAATSSAPTSSPPTSSVVTPSPSLSSVASTPSVPPTSSAPTTASSVPAAQSSTVVAAVPSSSPNATSFVPHPTLSPSTSPTLVASPSSTTSSAPAAAAPLSAGAKAGIGIGVSVGAVAVIGAVVVFIIARKHRERRIPRSSIKISDPLPGSGPFYGDSSRSERYNNVAELEMKSRRYEDMVPRQVPRNMV